MLLVSSEAFNVWTELDSYLSILSKEAVREVTGQEAGVGGGLRGRWVIPQFLCAGADKSRISGKYFPQGESSLVSMMMLAQATFSFFSQFSF